MSATYVSNEIEDFEAGGGLYPGGTGIIEDIHYTLWDYNGKQAKDSGLAVYMKFQPTDGSNEGKPVEQYWSCGDPAAFSPDPTGGFLIALKTRTAQSDNSKWGHVLRKFRDNCGLPPGMLSGKESGREGIKNLIRSEVTFALMDAPKYDIQKEGEAPADPKAKKFADKTLFPTKAKFPWEKGARGAAATKATPATAATPAATTTTAAAPASNGTGDVDMVAIITDIVKASDGSIMLADLPKEVMGKLADVDRKVRMGYIGQVKDAAFIEGLAKEHGWTFDGKELVIL